MKNLHIKRDHNFKGVLDIDQPPGMDPVVQYHGMQVNHPGYLRSKYEGFLTGGCQDIAHGKLAYKS